MKGKTVGSSFLGEGMAFSRFLSHILQNRSSKWFPSWQTSQRTSEEGRSSRPTRPPSTGMNGFSLRAYAP